MKRFLLFLSIAVSAVVASAQGNYPYDLRSDTLHVYHYDIHLDFSNFSSKKLNGWTRVYFSPISQSVNSVTLDLLGPDVDSVKASNGQLLPFGAGDKDFTVSLPAALGANDSSYFDVYYHGTPVTDSQFGGFYYSATYAYNVGVSLSDIPHNYGKTWFPCQDNFVNRSTYDMYITTTGLNRSACGGMLLGTVVNADQSRTEHWRIEQSIPSYLASVAVTSYSTVNKVFSGMNGVVPVQIAVRASDSTNLNTSFQNLEKAFDAYEEAYGSYKWPRVGYALTPMTGGAMEHAMNIAYPISLANGTASYQNVMAHELSHHWWGDLVTCKTAEDMWINEGSAAYCEHIFTEKLSGRTAYEAGIRKNHKNLLQSCHIDDDGYWPLSGVPQAHTYGTTTYSKGADILHTLRSYLGDSLYFSGLRRLLDENQFTDMDAIEYRDKLSAITGVDLTNYFNDWIFQGGWPHVSVDSSSAVTAGQQFAVTLYLKQKLTGRSEYSHHVPVTVTFRDANWNVYKTKVYADGLTNTVSVNVPFNPTMVYLNEDELISHAVTAGYGVVKATGNKSFSHANFNINTTAITDSVFLVVEHNWTAPDPIRNNPNNYTISQQRYWSIDGTFPAGFTTKGSVNYSGAKGFDDQLMVGREDSLIMLYRADRSQDWVEYDDYVKNMGSPTDKSGTITINNLKRGEYAFAMKGFPTGITENDGLSVQVYPNPADKRVKISCEKEMKFIQLTSVTGQLVREVEVNATNYSIELAGIHSGTYLINAFGKDGTMFTRQLVVK